MLSSANNVAAKGFYLAFVTTTVETNNPEAELKPGLDLLGPVLEKYVKLTSTLLLCYSCCCVRVWYPGIRALHVQYEIGQTPYKSSKFDIIFCVVGLLTL